MNVHPACTYLRWQTAKRFYEAFVHADLFGQSMLVVKWGERWNRKGQMRCIAVGDAVPAVLQELAARRRGRGYALVAVEPSDAAGYSQVAPQPRAGDNNGDKKPDQEPACGGQRHPERTQPPERDATGVDRQTQFGERQNNHHRENEGHDHGQGVAPTRRQKIFTELEDEDSRRQVYRRQCHENQ